MTGSNGKRQEITLGDEFDAVVRYGGMTVELHPGGNAVVYTNGDVKVRPAANDSAANSAEPKVGDMMQAGHPQAGWIYAGISETTHQPFYVAPKDSGVVQWEEAMVFAAKEGSRVPSKEELDQLRDARNRGALKGTFNVIGSYPDGWYWSSSQGGGVLAWAQRFSNRSQENHYKDSYSSLRCVRG